MTRKIITIDAKNCNGCGICAQACHEGAIVIQEGKAVLLRDDYCDGLGDCLPTCPTGAITFEEREALPFDKEAVEAHMAEMKAKKQVSHKKTEKSDKNNTDCSYSALNHWPVQLQLVSEDAEFLDNASLLIAADCCAYAMGRFHDTFMDEKVTLIGCPKLDATEYTQKLNRLLQKHPIHSIEVARMEVPCCGGLELAVKEACQANHQPYQVITLTTTGEIKGREKNF